MSTGVRRWPKPALLSRRFVCSFHCPRYFLLETTTPRTLNQATLCTLTEAGRCMRYDFGQLCCKQRTRAQQEHTTSSDLSLELRELRNPTKIVRATREPTPRCNTCCTRQILVLERLRILAFIGRVPRRVAVCTCTHKSVAGHRSSRH